MPFPPPGFFEAMAEAVDAEPDRFRHLGIASLRLCVLVEHPDGSSTAYGLVLDGDDVLPLGQVVASAFGPEVTVRGPEEAWAAMVADAAAHGAASGSQTLNALTLAGFPLAVEAEDPLGRDKFFRYAQTLQELFDAAATRTADAQGLSRPSVA
ncbi:hypothetical protein ACFFRE_06465 [Aciditerrimonas ferrireducens]|uniref:Uncharacterized protein n=1 Tax=Aciditerrimonas ferrireducens TaxID=667306 RepID=A0ABV6C288_9ACTN